ncbi:conserved hypothetical integral membrane protein [Oryzisolibacter propanilivorax]|uniref:Conserved hypothetical integral membrane protein n=2 Tax=Oryzisolibacter propanilivorax TaxID=1527607 RepID=A0A1G9S2A4_9BURK|nr:conserved hypothetical integral membrane protein [Oryzisolibacter propanilivorax]
MRKAAVAVAIDSTMQHSLSSSSSPSSTLPAAAPAAATPAPRASSPLRLLPGLLLAGALAALGTWLAQLPVMASHGFSALTLSIVLGLLVGNTLYPALAPRCADGVGLAKGRLLRAGIVLYGLRLTFQDIGQVGVAGVLIDAAMLTSTFLLAQWLGARLGLDQRTSILVGAGSSICGAAAVLATEPVAQGRPSDAAVAVATVVVFGTLGMFLYPALFHWNAAHGWLALDVQQYGRYVGSTVHEVAQVVAAGAAVGPQAADVAVIAKMVRVMMLAPFLLVLSLWLTRRGRGSAAGNANPRGGITIPWFAVLFIAMAGVNSLGVLPEPAVHAGIHLDNALLAIAMAGLGLTTHVGAIRAAGVRPLLLASVLFVWLVLGGLALNVLVPL